MNIDAERFWKRVDKSDSCWLWRGSHTTAGYGNLRLPTGKYDYAHRVSYRLSVGEIPPGLHLDHLCRVRDCVNPAHLEPVTPRENIRRGAAGYGPVRTNCRNGHDITDPANVYTEPGGNRRCRVCAKVAQDARTAARRARGRKKPAPKTHCKRGHEFDEQNTYITKAGHRQCRKCMYEGLKRRRERARADQGHE